jgi:hypothetical protein
MTDQEKLMELLFAFKVQFKTNLGKDYPNARRDMIEDSDFVVYLEGDNQDTPVGGMVGYHSFYSEYVFDKDGKFKYIGIWE